MNFEDSPRRSDNLTVVSRTLNALSDSVNLITKKKHFSERTREAARLINCLLLTRRTPRFVIKN